MAGCILMAVVVCFFIRTLHTITGQKKEEEATKQNP
jgi:hypothetical protein